MNRFNCLVPASIVLIGVLSCVANTLGQSTAGRSSTPGANRANTPTNANRTAPAPNRNAATPGRAGAQPTPARNGNGATASNGKSNPASAPTSSKPAPGAPAATAATKSSTPVTSTQAAKTNPSPSAKPVSGHLLQYKLKPGQIIHSEVQHLMKTSTKINDTSESTTARTVSQNIWEVTRVDENGEMTFVHRIDAVNGSKQIGDREEVRFDSRSDEEVHPDFRSIVEQIKAPVATITIDPSGRVTHRLDSTGKDVTAKSESGSHNLGMGEIAVRFPLEPIEVGHEWSFNRRIQVRRPDSSPKTIEIRELYKLEKLSLGVATIRIRSEPLTPVTEPEVEAQLIQEMSNGTIVFDVDAGHMISKELKWDQNVVGFSGPGSMIDYAGRFFEELKEVRTSQSASKSAPSKR